MIRPFTLLPFCSLLALGAPALCQVAPSALANVASAVLIHCDPKGPVPNQALLNSVLTPERCLALAVETAAGSDCKVTSCDINVYAASLAKSESQPPGVYQFLLGVVPNGSGTMPLAVAHRLLARLTAQLQQDLQVRLVEREQRPLEGLKRQLHEEMEKLQARLIALRRELLQGTPLTGIDRLRERAGELDRRQRDLELDLRTEQSLQELRMKMTADARERLQESSARLHGASVRMADLENHITQLRNSGPKPDLPEIAKATEERARRNTQLGLVQGEQRAAERDLEELANQARAATLKLHELSVRRALTGDELKRAQSDLEGAAERAAAMVPLQQAAAEAEAELTLLREQYAEASRRCAAVQPVRVELWR